MRNEIVQSDITVIGGGLSGVCAALAAARNGQKVALVQNRPVLGGNSSSEIRVWVVGATAHGVNRYARETGIMGELFVENQFRNPEGNPYLWDLLLLEKVRYESNIQLFLNTDVHEIEADGEEDDRHIRSVTGWMMGSERRIRFVSRVFLDCTGDGLIGFLAGAKFRLGREARHEFHEEWAPEVADDITLGSTILFYTKDTGTPVRYIPPSFAKDIQQTPIPMKRVIRSGDSGCHYWWIEWGGEHDIVHDNDRIRDELWSVVYGVWDYIKNSGNFNADTLTLEWVGAIPGKREYRRFVGDYVLNQNDIIEQKAFSDRIAFGGWSIDLHPPQGMYAEESGSKHFHPDGIYHIPFRSLYSVNVSNMLMAGRNISASHVAFGTTRVMATCAVIGEAAGTGAALCVQKDVTPRELHQNHMHELHQMLLRQDASIIGIRSEDPKDVARQATVRASSTLKEMTVEISAREYPLATDVGLLIPIDNRLERLSLLVDVAENSFLTVEIWDTGKMENYVPHTLQSSATVQVEKGLDQWVDIEAMWEPAYSQNAFIIIKANEHITLHVSDDQLPGVLAFSKSADVIASNDLEEKDSDQLVILWSMRQLTRQTFCFKAYPETSAYEPAKIQDGYTRPYGGAHLWSSKLCTDGQEQWLELSWAEPVAIGQIHVTFNDNVNEDLINLHHHRTPFRVMPELVKQYRLEVQVGDQWQTVQCVSDNRERKKVHTLEQPITSASLRLVIESTNGCPRAEVIEMRVYR